MSKRVTLGVNFCQPRYFFGAVQSLGDRLSWHSHSLCSSFSNKITRHANIPHYQPSNRVFKIHFTIISPLFLVLAGGPFPSCAPWHSATSSSSWRSFLHAASTRPPLPSPTDTHKATRITGGLRPFQKPDEDRGAYVSVSDVSSVATAVLFNVAQRPYHIQNTLQFIHSCIHSLVFSLRGRAGRNQSPVMWPVWLWHTASWASSWG